MEWKTVKGFNAYSVSNTGLIRLDETGRILKAFSNHGYSRVNLFEVDSTGKRKNRKILVHRLVADAFLAPISGKHEIDHINGIRNDNRPENLKWSTRRENMNNALTLEVLRRNAAITNRKPEYRAKQSASHDYKKIPVRCLETGEILPSGSEAAKAFGINRRNVYFSCKNAQKPGAIRLKNMKGKPVLHFERVSPENKSQIIAKEAIS